MAKKIDLNNIQSTAHSTYLDYISGFEYSFDIIFYDIIVVKGQWHWSFWVDIDTVCFLKPGFCTARLYWAGDNLY